MLTIRKDNSELKVTVGSYRNMYAGMGYEVVLPVSTETPKQKNKESLEKTKQDKTTKK